MQKIAVVILLAASLALSGCGSNSHLTGNINGTWNATLTSAPGETMTAFTFVTNLTVNGDGSLGSSSFNFTLNNTSCTFPATTESGFFTLSANLNGQVSGSFHYVVTSTGTSVNTLTLDGMVSAGQISGSWTVKGADTGCSGNGTFTMNPMLGA